MLLQSNPCMLRRDAPPSLCVYTICSLTVAADSHLVERFCCVNMGSLPENPIRYKTRENEDWQRILLDLTPLWIILLICFIYILTCCLKYFWIKIYKKINCKTKMNARITVTNVISVQELVHAHIKWLNYNNMDIFKVITLTLWKVSGFFIF